jgi:hypothetical protein
MPFDRALLLQGSRTAMIGWCDCSRDDLDQCPGNSSPPTPTRPRVSARSFRGARSSAGSQRLWSHRRRQELVRAVAMQSRLVMSDAGVPGSSTANVAAPSPASDSWTPPQHYTYVSIDRAFKANLARLTFGISPVALAQPYFDWLAHLVTFSGKQMQLVEDAAHTLARLAAYAAQTITGAETAPCITPLPQDHRFQSAAWHVGPTM